ncbi:MAG TPA: hypothetical protein VK066_30200 [Chloroflexota bacterium]|nr:hypothetical protein [Chloroflexota bacterium]
MRLQAEVHCYHCGHVSGTWVWLPSQPDHGVFTETHGARRSTQGPVRPLRCLRCRGPIFLDEINPVVESPVLEFTAPRRGRPPKASRAAAS